MKGFNFTASRLSRYFHTRGASSNEDVARVWCKYISPTLDPDTGIASTIFGDSDGLDSQSSADQSLFQSPLPPLNKTPLSQDVQSVTPNSKSRYVSFKFYCPSVLYNPNSATFTIIHAIVISHPCLGISVYNLNT